MTSLHAVMRLQAPPLQKSSIKASSAEQTVVGLPIHIRRCCCQGGSMTVTYKARYGQPAASCTITATQRTGQSAGSSSLSQEGREFAGSEFWRPLPSGLEESTAKPQQLLAALHDPARAVTPQQEFVMYDGEVRET